MADIISFLTFPPMLTLYAGLGMILFFGMAAIWLATRRL